MSSVQRDVRAQNKYFNNTKTFYEIYTPTPSSHIISQFRLDTPVVVAAGLLHHQQ